MGSAGGDPSWVIYKQAEAKGWHARRAAEEARRDEAGEEA